MLKLKRSGWTMQDLSEGGVVARNKKEREEWRKKPALKPPQGVPHPPVHHYSHSSVSLIFHFQVLIYIALTGAIINNHAYILQWFTLYHHCNSDAPHISCLKVKSCNSQHYHGAFLHHLQQHGCSSVTNHICNIQVPQLWFTSSSSPNCPYPGWPPIRGCKFVWTTPKPNSPPGFFLFGGFFLLLSFCQLHDWQFNIPQFLVPVE